MIPVALVKELEKIRGELEQINRDVESLCAGLSEEQLGWRPEPERWSIAENLIHLRTTAEVFLPTMDEAIEEATRKNLRSDGPFKLSLKGRLFCWYTEPPPKIRLPAPAPLRPLLKGPATEALPLFLESQRWVVQRLEAASGLDLNRARIRSPLAKFITMDLLTLFSVCVTHGRHIWQARNIPLRHKSS